MIGLQAGRVTGPMFGELRLGNFLQRWTELG